MKEILLRSHLGLGDMLIVNAIVRHLAQRHAVTLLCKPHNTTAVAFMFRDMDNVTIIDVDDDAMADGAVKEVKRHGKTVLGLGMYGDPQKWELGPGFDRWFYAQAGLDHKERWNGFKCARQESRELEVPSGKYCFVHDDATRGFVIPPEALPAKRMKIVRPDKELKNRNGDASILFDYWGWLDNAQELHFIDSSFSILYDHLHLPKFANKKVVLHLGLRGGNEYPPTRLKDFEIVRHNKFVTTI